MLHQLVSHGIAGLDRDGRDATQQAGAADVLASANETAIRGRAAGARRAAAGARGGGALRTGSAGVLRRRDEPAGGAVPRRRPRLCPRLRRGAPLPCGGADERPIRRACRGGLRRRGRRVVAIATDQLRLSPRPSWPGGRAGLAARRPPGRIAGGAVRGAGAGLLLDRDERLGEIPALFWWAALGRGSCWPMRPPRWAPWARVGRRLPRIGDLHQDRAADRPRRHGPGLWPVGAGVTWTNCARCSGAPSS